MQMVLVVVCHVVVVECGSVCSNSAAQQHTESKHAFDSGYTREGLDRIVHAGEPRPE